MAGAPATGSTRVAAWLGVALSTTMAGETTALLSDLREERQEVRKMLPRRREARGGVLQLGAVARAGPRRWSR
jgi:hypothetical protein